MKVQTDGSSAARDRRGTASCAALRCLSLGVLAAAVTSVGVLILFAFNAGFYFALMDRLTWRLGAASVIQQRVEQLLTATQLRGDDQVSLGATLFFFGDSHLHGLAVGEFGGKMINYAIAGEPAGRLRDRIVKYRSLASARAVVLLTGQNDLVAGRSPSEIADSVRGILTRLAHVSRIVLVEIPPAREERPQVVMRRELNEELHRVCADSQSCRFAALTSLQDDTGQLSTRFASRDGIHLNAAGYSVLASTVASSLSTVGGV